MIFDETGETGGVVWMRGSTRAAKPSYSSKEEAKAAAMFPVGCLVEVPVEEGRPEADLGVVVRACTESMMRDLRRSALSFGQGDPGPLVSVATMKLDGPFAFRSAAATRKIKVASPAVVRAHKAKVKAAVAKLAEPWLKVGERVKIRQDRSVQIDGGMFGPRMVLLRKGTEAIVDTNPVQPVDEPSTDGGVRRHRGEVEHGEIPGRKEPWSDYMVPSLKLYFPTNNGELQVPLDMVEPAPYDARLFEQLVLPATTKQRLLSMADRVLNAERQKFIYDQMGLSSFCQKGRGTICLLHGAPGTGKTMTAEAIADRLKRPLIRVLLGGTFDPDDIAAMLRRAFDRAERYNAVLLIDEADIFIRKRGHEPVLDGVVAGFLRALEYYQGLLFMTTNLGGSIDPAIFSRAHVVLGYEEPDTRLVWDRLLPAQVKEAIMGGASAWPALREVLAEKKLNGREIKTVIQNAVTRASAGLDVTAKPDKPWISASFFVEEADALVENKAALSR